MAYTSGENKSVKYPGVSLNLHTGKYEARITVAGKAYYLGIYSDPSVAASQYDRWCDMLGVPERKNESSR